MDKKELVFRLIKADEEASMICQSKERIEVIIGGGSVLMINNLLSRQTQDIDTIGNPYGAHSELKEVFEKYDINPRMNTFALNLADNWENRLNKVDLGYKTILLDYYTISIEDLVIMKLHSHRGKDANDIRTKEVLNAIDWDLLQNIIDSGEANNSFNEREYKEFLTRYKEYKKEIGRQDERTKF